MSLCLNYEHILSDSAPFGYQNVARCFQLQNVRVVVWSGDFDHPGTIFLKWLQRLPAPGRCLLAASAMVWWEVLSGSSP